MVPPSRSDAVAFNVIEAGAGYVSIPVGAVSVTCGGGLNTCPLEYTRTQSTYTLQGNNASFTMGPP
jgi:hypothetical protein